MNRPVLLLVDDLPEMALVVRRHCNRMGVEVVHRTGVADGWDALRERMPHLLLLDMRLNGESGADLCQRVRATPELATLRVALFTSWTLEEHLRAGLEAGADLVFDKDLVVQPDAWRQRLTEILGWTHGRVWAKLVAWKADHARLPFPDWLTVYNQALRQAVGQGIGAALLHIVLRRAVQATLAHDHRREEPGQWLYAGDAVLNEEYAARAASPETVAFLGTALAEQMWCMLGSRDSAFFTTALTPVIPGLTEAMLLG